MQVSPFRKRHLPSRQDSANARSVSMGWESERGRAAAATQPRDDANSPCPWWGPGSLRPIVKEGVLKKRGGRINAWGDRYFILREDLLEQYAKGETPPSHPKHCYVLDPSCAVSEMKETKAGGRTLFYFELGWPSMSSKEEGEDEGDGESGRSGAEGDGRDLDANGSPNSDVPTPLDSPTDGGGGRGVGAVNARGYGSEDASGGLMPLPIGPPQMERVNSSSSLTGQPDLRFRRPRSNTANGLAGSAAVSPKPLPQKRSGAGVGEEGDETKRNETIESMVAAQRENETRMARLKRGELGHLSEYEREKERHKKKKDGKSVINTKSQAVAATAVGVSWLTAGIMTGGLVVAGTMVAAGVTVGSMGVYNKYKSTRKPNGAPGRVRVASDKVEVVEQWRQGVLDQLENLRQGTQRSVWTGPGLGLGLGMPGWTSRPEGPPPALKAIDLRVVDNLLAKAVWVSREVMHGLPVMEQEVGAVAGGDVGSGHGEYAAAGAHTVSGLGGTGPVLKTQTIVRASPLETFVALMGAPKNSQTAVVSGTLTVQSLDDHSDVVRLCLRPAWLKLAWASPRDFCLARYWHMAEDGCYIVALSSMEHPLCPVDTAFVRGEAHLVYTISPRRDSMPGGHASSECMLACHAQVDPKGWVWNRLGFREMYMKHILMTALGVRDVIEAERFMTPRVSLRSEGGTNCLANGQVGVGPRSPDGSPFLFEVLGPAGPEASQQAAPASSGTSLDVSRWTGSSSLESCPPPALDRRRWSEAIGTDFMVRGPSYLTTRVKVASAKQMFRLRAVDLFVLPEPATHLAAHPGNRVHLARKAGETTFVWVLQIMVPGPPHYAFVCYFTPGSDNWLDQSTPFGKLAKRVFFGDSDSFRDERLKLIPKIVEGNWVVKRAAGSTPAILGTKLKQHHFRGDNYLETDLEIASSSLAANITRLCTGYAKALVVDMVWTLQGNTREELPEVALGGVRINALDLLAAQPLDLEDRIVVEARITASTGSTRRPTNSATTSLAMDTTTNMATHGHFCNSTTSNCRSIPITTRPTTRNNRITSACKGVVGEGGGTGDGQQGRSTHVTVVSYNVLADSLVSFDYIPYCKTWNEAAWRARPGRVLQKVLEFRPTVVCLQEVDESQYDTLFKKELGSLGYVGAYFKRSGGKSDGCATFVLGNEMRLVEQEDVPYKVQGHPVLDRDNVALLVVVDVLSRSQSPTGEGSFDGGATSQPSAAGRRDAGARLVIANTHLVFNPKRGDVKTAQLMLLTSRVERLAKSSGADGVMICGDFNMTPDSALYHYMVRGALAVDGLNRFFVSGQCGSNNSQRKEPDNSGTLSSRGPGLKHQGSGCSLGSYQRPSHLANTSGGERGEGGIVRGRGGRGGQRGRGMRGRTPSGPSCQACSNRLPHYGPSTYVINDTSVTDYRSPPGARPGTLFAVMDPAPCRCVTADENCPTEGFVGKRKAGNETGSGDEVRQMTREPYDPPVLWPVNGDKFAYRRDRGPVVHDLRLESAYAQQADAWGTGEPAFSSYHHMFKGTVDYIFYGPGPGVFSDDQPCASPRQEISRKLASATDSLAGEVSPRPEGERSGCLRCVGVAEPPLRRDLDRFGGLPSPEEPSDHILLAARFEVTLR
eukprot:g14470.t1